MAGNSAYAPHLTRFKLLHIDRASKPPTCVTPDKHTSIPRHPHNISCHARHSKSYPFHSQPCARWTWFPVSASQAPAAASTLAGTKWQAQHIAKTTLATVSKLQSGDGQRAAILSGMRRPMQMPARRMRPKRRELRDSDGKKSRKSKRQRKMRWHVLLVYLSSNGIRRAQTL